MHYMFLFLLMFNLSDLYSYCPCSVCKSNVSHKKEYGRNGIIIEHQYFVVTKRSGRAYLTIKNTTDLSDELLGVSHFTPLIKKAEIQQSSSLPEGVDEKNTGKSITVPANGKVILTADTKHIILTELKDDFFKEDKINLILIFR